MSAAASAVLDHRLPHDVETGLYQACSNCGRSTFVCNRAITKTRQGRSAMCCTCAEQIKTPENQLWACRECGTWRAWGTGKPEETKRKALRCDRCSDATTHEFVKVA